MSLATIRRLLLLLSILPDIILSTSKGLPIYLYSLLTFKKLLLHVIQAALYKRLKKKTCCICKNKVPPLLFIDNRCYDCYIDKHCKPILFGKLPWKKLLNNTLVSKAIAYLTNIKLSTK